MSGLTFICLEKLLKSMRNRIFLILALCVAVTQINGQSFTSYFTGDSADVDTPSVFGVTLMGGAGESDQAMTWFLERASGGDVVVIRASGSNGYNDYMYSELGVDINSVETIVFNNASAAEDAYVIQQLQNAEAIWMAGGDQWDYVSYWKGTAVEDAINHLLNVKQGPVGGISAGMAVLGGSYFSAMNGTVYSDESLEDPYNDWLQLGHNDFLQTPFLTGVVTDTHYDDPDRRGRHMCFMARMAEDAGIYPLGIACDEYAAVCIDSEGMAWCYGEFPEFDDYVYFLRPNCPEPWEPEECSEGMPLEWNRGQAALKAYRVESTEAGDKYFDLNDWLTGSGGQWQDWWASNGQINFVEDTQAPDCEVVTINEPPASMGITIFPVPSQGLFDVTYSGLPTDVVITDKFGRRITTSRLVIGTNRFDLRGNAAGQYHLTATDGSWSEPLIIIE